jgi:hypothetical protein
MAKNRKDEHYPVVRAGRLDYTGPAVSPQIELNFEQYLSKTNRRLYRQSRCYDVKLDIDAGSTQTYNVYALSDSWMNERALKMAYAMYLENGKDERDRLKSSAIARWEDFRVLSGTGFQQVNPAQFNMPGLTPVQLANGEFDNSIVVDSAGVAKNFTWASAGTGFRYSILEQYDKAGNAQNTPETSTGDMPYDDLMADDDAAMANALQVRGNAPPYDRTGVSADRTWVKVATLAAGTAQRLSTGFFRAPCGFVIITAGTNQDELVDVSKFEWTAKAGDYKGVHAPSLLE